MSRIRRCHRSLRIRHIRQLLRFHRTHPIHHRQPALQQLSRIHVRAYPDHYGDHDTTQHEHDAHDGGDATGGDGPAGGSGGTGGTTPTGTGSGTGTGGTSSTPTTPTPPQVPLVPSRISVRRPADLLVFDVTFGGFVLETNPPRLVRATPDAYFIFEFPPQSFGEEAFFEAAQQPFSAPPADDQIEVSSHPDYPDKNVQGGVNETPPAQLPSARVRMSGPSRVAVTMPAERSRRSATT